MKWTIRALSSFFCSSFLPVIHADMLRCFILTMSLYLRLLDILESLILLIFKKRKKEKRKAFLPQAAEEEFVFSGFLFPDEES